MEQMNEIKDIECRIAEIKREMEQLFASMGENRKSASLVKSYISDIDDTEITREEYYKLLVGKKRQLAYDINVSMKLKQIIRQVLREEMKNRIVLV